MAEIGTRYNPETVESKWYDYWQRSGFFRSEVDPNREPYTIVIPPPNVTGVLHMGHMLNNTIQDILVRKARLDGKNACWVPGMDHASIATEAKVVKRLREKGIKKSDIGRDEFLKHAWEWKEEYGGVILEQLKMLGASCDWDRTRFTMDERYYESVIDAFIHLYNKGLIYRGIRMVNWDPEALTALSDEEVIYTEENSKLYYVRYRIAGAEDFVTIATTRPETILADTAICIHPDDERYKHLHGKSAIVPIVNRKVPIILDDYVSMEFGTGCLKVTPAHDANDYELGIKHDLEVIEILSPDGKLTEAATVLIGQDRFEARENIVPLLDREGALVKIESYVNKVGRSERTNAVIEPRLSKQWFVKMDSLAGPALNAVEQGEIRFYPAKFVNTFRHWMTNIKDWCISRQLWWGHRIPAWYFGNDDEYVVAKTRDEALEKARKKSGRNLHADDLRQDEDVVDTWFSSWLWPISVFDGFYRRDELDYYYPTNDLVTGPDIIFFWVARMIMAGYEFEGKKPFSSVYFTGLIRDKAGRKMSKSLGNSPDPIELIKTYSADGVRLGLMLSAPAGNDIPFDVSICKQGRNFTNKIWNALRLIKSWEVKEDATVDPVNRLATEWMRARINREVEQINHHYSTYRLNDMSMSIFKLIRDEFCSWYLELIKPDFGAPVDSQTYTHTIDMFEQLMVLLHPVMPFITEEVWQALKQRDKGDSIMVARWPETGDYDQSLIESFEFAKTVISEVRGIRAKNNIAMKEELELIAEKTDERMALMQPVISKLARVTVRTGQADSPTSASFIADTVQFAIPLANAIDVDAERKKIREELEYQKDFLQSIERKLGNQRFVQNAPEQVVNAERKKMEDTLSRIKSLEEKLASLS